MTRVMTRVNLPRPASLHGLHSPGAGFEQPFAMLDACHDRVRRSLGLLSRLRAHVAQQGADEQARQAARDVLRYFDIAAPQHHEDEERHIFPLLLARSPEAGVHALVRQLQQEHQAMNARWAQARGVLQALADGAVSRWSAADEALLEQFASLYDTHLAHEDQRIYPAAQALLDAASLHAMGQEMAQRRGARL